MEPSLAAIAHQPDIRQNHLCEWLNRKARMRKYPRNYGAVGNTVIEVKVEAGELRLDGFPPEVEVRLSANASVLAAVVASPRIKERRAIIETGIKLQESEETELIILANHIVPDLCKELDLPPIDPALVKSLAQGELDRRRRTEKSGRWGTSQAIAAALGIIGACAVIGAALLSAMP